jgi:hypothetical protein
MTTSFTERAAPRTHLASREIAVSRGLLPQAHINLPSVFGKRENAGMIQTLQSPAYLSAEGHITDVATFSEKLRCELRIDFGN